MAKNNIISNVKIDGANKCVLSAVALDGDIDLQSLNNTLVSVDTGLGVKRAVAVAVVGGGGSSETPRLEDVIKKDPLMTIEDTIIVSGSKDSKKSHILLENAEITIGGIATIPPIFEWGKWNFALCNLSKDGFVTLHFEPNLSAYQENIYFNFGNTIEGVYDEKFKFKLFVESDMTSCEVDLKISGADLIGDVSQIHPFDLANIYFTIACTVDDYPSFNTELQSIHFNQLIREPLVVLNDDDKPVINNNLIDEKNLINKDDIIDSLDSINAEKPLSANQGKVLNTKLSDLKGALIPAGYWDALENEPDISGASSGEFFIVSIAGSTELAPFHVWGVNDWAVKTTTGWAKIDNSTNTQNEDVENWINGLYQDVRTLHWEKPRIGILYFRPYTKREDKQYTAKIQHKIPYDTYQHDGHVIFEDELITTLLPSPMPSFNIYGRYNAGEMFQTSNTLRYYYLWIQDHKFCGDFGSQITWIYGWFNFE